MEPDRVARCGESRVLPLVADVTQGDDCARVVDAAVRQFGRLDILVNTAGRGMKYVSNEFMMARRAVPVMLEAGWGRIVNVSASQTTIRRRGFSPYGPSKAALESATIIWAQDLDGTRVTVNALLPGGPTLTGMVPENDVGAGEIGDARSEDHRPAAAMARVAGVGWDDGSSIGGDEVAGW